MKSQARMGALIGKPPPAGEPLTAVILAAGLGTRLRPLSHRVPKPLFPILNLPLLELILGQLQAAGFTRIVLNTHHLAAEIEVFLVAAAPPQLEIYLYYEPQILGTGGGLKNVAEVLGRAPFLVINGDIVTDLDLAGAYRRHRPGALATMILHDCPRFNNVWLDDRGQIGAFGASPGQEARPPLAFTGIQVVTPRLLERIPPGRFVNIIDTYRQAIQDGATIAAAVENGFYWQDMGTPQDYLDIHRQLLAGNIPSLSALFPPLTDPWLGRDVELEGGVSFAGGVCLGDRVRVGGGVSLKNTVVWSDAILEPGISLEDCVVGRGARVRRSAQGGCIEA